MDEIYTFSRSSDHVEESKNTRLLRFRFMLGENVTSFRSESKKHLSRGPMLGRLRGVINDSTRG